MNRNYKVLFIHCGRYNDLTPQITMGLWGLADLANSIGYKAQIIHTKVEELKNHSFDVLKYIDQDVILVGFSAHWFPMVEETIDLIKQIHTAFPNLFICLGGYSASIFAKDIMKYCPGISAIIQGDGEKPLIKLLECLKDDITDYSDVPNLVWRSQDKKIKTNRITYVSTSEDVEKLHFAKIDQYLYEYEESKDIGYEYAGTKVDIISFCYDTFFDFRIKDFTLGKTFYLLTGKGCYANCLFCGGGHNSQKIINNRSRCMFLSEQQIINTIKDAQKLNYDSFYICFDPLPEKPHYYSLLKKIKEEKLDIALMFGFWALPKDEALDLFQGASKRLIFEISPETNNEVIRNKVRGYSFTNSQMYDVISKCYQRKIYTHLYFSYPLPYETIKDIRDDREAMMELNIKYPHYIEAFYIRLSTDPASPLYNDPEKYGCQLDVTSFEEHLHHCSSKNGSDNILVHRNNNISLEDMEIKRLSNDHKMKSMLSYDLKLLGQAFASAGELLNFLDGFYNYMESKVQAQQIHNNADIIFLLKEYVRLDQSRTEWLVELLDLIFTEIHLKQLISNKHPASINRSAPLHLAKHAKLLNYHYNVNEVRDFLWKEKKFSPCKKRDEPIHLLAVRNDSIELYELNESLYLLIKEFEKTSTIENACQNVAGYFSEDEQETDEIRNEMMNVVQSLLEQRMLADEKSDLYEDTDKGEAVS